MSVDRQEWLEICAYYLWESEGCPQGRDRAHWEAAERAFDHRAPAPTTAPQPAARSVKEQLLDAASADGAAPPARKAAPATRRRKKLSAPVAPLH